MKKVVLVEDNPFLIDIYTTKFKEVGFDVKVANDGEIVLDLLNKEKPDILILDIVLPNISGWELLKEIRKNEQFKDLPIIIFSNLGEKQQVEKGINLGAVRYLIKAQYTPSEIVEEVKKILEGDKKHED